MIKELHDNLYTEGMTLNTSAAFFEPAELATGITSSGVDDRITVSFEIPDSCLQGLADLEAGRVLDLEKALREPPPAD